jgi:hypothetical protein
MKKKTKTRQELTEERAAKLIGKRFGHSTVIKYTGRSVRMYSGKKSSIYLLRCDCGNTFEKPRDCFSNSLTCGCRGNTNRVYKKRGSYLSGNTASFNHIYGVYKSRAKYKNIKFKLSKAEFKKLTGQNCIYCGVKPLQISKADLNRPNNEKYVFNGIDRIDSLKGYIKSNCVPCCEICNKAKRNLSREDFLIWIKRLVSFYSMGYNETK